MAHFDFRSPDFFVEKTADGVRVNHVDYTLDGDKVMDDDLHIYTIDFDARRIQRGNDFFVWEMGVTDFGEWSQRLNKSPDDWDYLEETPNYLRIEGRTYRIDGAERAWPLPKLYYNFVLKGHILTEVDCETGATERKIRWAEDMETGEH
jgi:hypothetical protein